MRILSLTSENIKKIKVAHVVPGDSNVVLVTGKNGQGKSSLIDSIAMSLGGKELIPEKPIRDGEKTASITVDLGEYKVTRHWTESGQTYLKLENKEGAKFTNGQTILDKLVGNLTFDPLAFVNMEPSKRLKILKEITQLDFSKLDAERKVAYDLRTDVNRAGDMLKARVASEFKGIETEPLVENIDDIKAEKAKAIHHNDKVMKNKNRMFQIENEIDAINIEAKETEDKIKALQAKMVGFAEKGMKLIQEKTDLKESEETYIDVIQFDNKIEENYKQQQALEKYKMKLKVEAELNSVRATWKTHDDKIKEIDATKEKMVSDAKMPIGGLSFGDGEILFNGIPFAQINTAQQIEISFAIAIALNPKLKIAIIKNGSLLDSESMKSIEAIATVHDYQVWIERVSDKAESGVVYIEDGMVVS